MTRAREALAVAPILAFVLFAALVGSAPQPAHAAGELLWSDAFDQNLGADQANEIAVKGRRVVTAGRSDDLDAPDIRQFLLRALDAKTGAPLWSYQLDHVQTSEAVAMVVAGKRAFVALEAENADGSFSGDDWMVSAHDLKTGAPVWEDIAPSSGDENVAALAVKGSRVFAGGEVENRVDPASGRDWLVRAVSAKSRTFLWEDVHDSALATDRVVAIGVSGNRVIAAGISNDAAAPDSAGDWLIRALDHKKGTLLWQKIVDRGGADTVRDMGVVGRTAVVVGRATDGAGVAGANDWFVQAYDTKTGALLWEDAVDYALDDDEARKVAVGKKQVVVVGGATNAISETSGEDWIVRAHDTKTGALLWEDVFDGANETDRAEQVEFAGKIVLVAGRSQQLVEPGSGNDWVVRAYDVQTGALLWSDVYDGALGNDRPSSTAHGIAVKGKQAFITGRSANAVDVDSSRDAVVRAYNLK